MPGRSSHLHDKGEGEGVFCQQLQSASALQASCLVQRGVAKQAVCLPQLFTAPALQRPSQPRDGRWNQKNTVGSKQASASNADKEKLSRSPTPTPTPGPDLLIPWSSEHYRRLCQEEVLVSFSVATMKIPPQKQLEGERVCSIWCFKIQWIRERDSSGAGAGSSSSRVTHHQEAEG